MSLITAKLVSELLACPLEGMESSLELGLVFDVYPHVVFFILQWVAEADILVGLHNA